MLYNALAFLIIAVVSLFGLSRIWQSGENYDVDKTSPDGIYRVRIEIRAGEGKHTTRGYIERGRYQFFKGKEILHTYEWNNPYQYEPTFRESTPVIEWVDNNVVRMGRDRSDQPFNDEFIVSNNTDEYLKYVDVNYGKNESFWVLDFAPRSQITLHPSPEFKPDHSSNYFLGYGGMTQSGKKFEGKMESKQRKSPADGPLKFHITIKTSDLR
jgi:hypothetical protein